MASLWDTLVTHVRSQLPSHQAVNSAGEAVLDAPFDAAKFVSDLFLKHVTDLPSVLKEGKSVLTGDFKGAAKEIVNRENSESPISKGIQAVHDAIHKDVAPPTTTAQRYVDAAIRAGPAGLASEAASENLPDKWWKPAAVELAGAVAGIVTPEAMTRVKGLANLPKFKAEDFTPEAPLTQDGMPGNGSVRPIDPHEIASIMNDQAAVGKGPSEAIEPEAPTPNRRASDIQVPDVNDNDPLRASTPQEDPSLVQSEQPPIEAQAQTNEALAPQGFDPTVPLAPEAFTSHDNVVDFPSEKVDYSNIKPVSEASLTPAEKQEMDASVPTTPVDNTGYEAHTPYIDKPAAPANDVNRLDAAKNLIKNIMGDESGVLKYEDEDPAAPKYPESFYKLAQALREGVPARNKQEGIYHAELQKRVADMAVAREKGSGIEGFHAEKGTLKGKMPTVQDYEGMSGLSQDDLSELFDHIKNHPSLGWFQSINARDGLAKILQGEVPTRTEITYLAKTMPPELIRELMKHRTLWAKIMEGAVSTLNVPKALMASYDVSAPLRQGVLMVGRKQFYTALGPMFKAFVSPKYAKAVRDGIYEDALYPVMSDSGLAIPKYDETGPMELGEHEEPFMTDLAGKIPLIKIGVKASERAFNTFVYKLRADSFKAIYDAAREGGKSWTKNSTKDLSRMINTFTGRGDLGKFNNMAPALNTMFFSPRLMKSRLDSLNPVFYAKLDPTVRLEAFKQLASFVTIAGTVMGLAKLAGAEVGSDPRQADGWKIKMGNTRYDILGGEQQLIRLFGNIATYSYLKSKEIAKTGEIHTGYKDKTAVDNIGQFLRNKESPDVSLAHDFLAGNTAVGEPFSPKNAVTDRLTPMSAGDAHDVYEDAIKHGVPQDKALAQALLLASPGLLGASVSTYEPHTKASRGGGSFKMDFNTSFGSFKKEKF